MLPIRESIEQSLHGTERERTEKIVRKADAINAMRKEWKKEGAELTISLAQYEAYEQFLEIAPMETELELLDQDGQPITTTVGELLLQYNPEDEEDKYTLIKMLHELKMRGSEGNRAWRENWSKITRIARVYPK